MYRLVKEDRDLLNAGLVFKGKGFYMSANEKDLQPCLIHIDKEGKWFHRGIEMVRHDFVRSFYRQMELDGAGQYAIFWGGKRCYVEVEDTAFVVRRVSRYADDGGEYGGGFVLRLSDDTEEPLMPDTLYIGESNVLYCRVKEKRFPARFNRSAYYQLAEHVEADGEDYVLPVNGRRYRIGR